jgi:phage terminase large subunit-like protein
MLPSPIFDELDALPDLVRQHLGDRRTARIGATRNNPLLFAFIYLRPHLRDHAGQLSLSAFHLDMAEFARGWTAPVDEPGSARSAWIAPRGCGKSTWLFLVLPMWAAAHGHKKFAAAFAHSGPQAEQHLSTFRNELDNNPLLRSDYPDLCLPKTRDRGLTVADTNKQMTRRNGFTFVARGIDEGVLGMKVESVRPDLIILDDIEPDEASYSLYQVGKRRGTLLDAVLPINVRAHVVLAGTTTIADGIVHQLVKHALGEDAEDGDNEWIEAERFSIHYYPAIVEQADGTETSLWPEKWSLDYLLSIRHTRTFAKNMDNKPVATDGAYWEDADLHDAGDLVTTRRMLSLDPATTTKQTSDYTGAATLGLVPPVYLTDERGVRRLVAPARAVVERTWRLRVVGETLRQWVLAQLAADPGITVVLVETNQGGEHWHTILHDLPVRLVTVHQTEPKEVRAGRLLSGCQRRVVLFRGRQKAFRDEALAFPNVTHDDVIDAVGSGVHRMLGSGKRKSDATGTTLAYAG